MDVGDTAHHASDWLQPVGPLGPSVECKRCVQLLFYLVPTSMRYLLRLRVEPTFK